MGSPVRLPAPNAAFANATLCHALDFDDTHGDAGCHVGVVVAPSVLAAAQASDAAGRETIVAYVLGSETILRIGMAAPRAFHRRGFHPTSVCGVFGAAAASAKLSELALPATTSALGLAGSFPAGNFAYLNDGTPTKPLNPGSPRTAGCSRFGWPRRAPWARLPSWKGATGSMRPMPMRTPTRSRPGGRPGDALGDTDHRVQGLPGMSRHAWVSGRRGAVDAPARAHRRDRADRGVGRRSGHTARARTSGSEDRTADPIRGQVLASVLDLGDARSNT